MFVRTISFSGLHAASFQVPEDCQLSGVYTTCPCSVSGDSSATVAAMIQADDQIKSVEAILCGMQSQAGGVAAAESRTGNFIQFLKGQTVFISADSSIGLAVIQLIFDSISAELP